MRATSKPNPYLARNVRAIRRMHADGWTLSLLVEIALAGQPAHRKISPEELEVIREMYIEALPKGLRP